MIPGPGIGGAGRAILAIQLKRLGDLVLALPAIRSLVDSGAEVTLVTEAPFHDVIEGMSGAPSAVRLHPRESMASLLFGESLRGRFDAAVDFEGSARSARLAWQSGSKVRIGWEKRMRRLAYTDAVPVPPSEPPMHTADQKNLLVARLGISRLFTDAPLSVTDAERAEAAARIGSEARIGPATRWLAAMPASRRRYKRLPAASLAAIVASFRARTGAPVVLLGGPGEEEQLEAVRRLLDDPPPIILARSIRELMALLAGAGAVVGPDGGARHLAEGLDRPTLPLFGPQNPVVWTRLSPRHRAIRARRADCALRCSRIEEGCACLAALDRGRVADELVALWNGESAAG